MVHANIIYRARQTRESGYLLHPGYDKITPLHRSCPIGNILIGCVEIKNRGIINVIKTNCSLSY